MMSVVCITCSAFIVFISPSLFAILGYQGTSYSPLTLQVTSQGAMGDVFVCLYTVLLRRLCMWINWAWMMMMMIVLTTMFIACPCKTKNNNNKKRLPACRAWNVTICSLTPDPFVIFHDHILSFSSLLLGPSRSPTRFCLWNTELWIDVCSIGSSMVMCSVSLPLRCPFLCERDPGIYVCRIWHVLSFLLHLFNDPDICYGAHALYCWPYSFLSWAKSCSTTKPLCMWSSVQMRLCYLSVEGWSSESLV